MAATAGTEAAPPSGAAEITEKLKETKMDQGNEEAEAADEDEEEAVSYTHLTLPTILLV